MAARGWGVLLAAALLAGCASTPPASRQINAVVDGSAEKTKVDANVQEVLRGVQMILDGKVQAAIDGPFNTVADRFETKYGRDKVTYFSARGMTDALLYAALPATQKTSQSVVVLGPAWAMAYWGRGYAYNEMARYDDALVELKKRWHWRRTTRSTTSRSATATSSCATGTNHWSISRRLRHLPRSRCPTTT